MKEKISTGPFSIPDEKRQIKDNVLLNKITKLWLFLRLIVQFKIRWSFHKNEKTSQRLWREIFVNGISDKGLLSHNTKAS